MKFDKKTKVLMTIAQAYETKTLNKALTDKLETIVLPSEIELQQDLKEGLEQIGDNPINEPELYEARTNKKTFREKLFQKLELEVDNYDAVEITELLIVADKQISDITDLNGVYKTTEALKEIKLPKTTQIESLTEIVSSNETEAKKVELYTKKLYEIAQVNEDDISEWEKQLLIELYSSFVRANGDAISLRQAVDKTPFARYLKN